MEYNHTYHVSKNSGTELKIQEIDRVKINYDEKKSRLEIIGEDVEFALSVLRLNNPEIEFTKVKNGKKTRT